MNERERPSVGSFLRALLHVLLTGWICLSLGLGCMLGYQNSHPPRRLPERAASCHGPRAREVSFPASDGLRIRGTWSPPEGERPVLVMVHGIGANRDEYVPWAHFFSRLGYGVLAFDWRAHGRSEGDALRFGLTESRDLVGALEWIRGQVGERPVAILAQSLGAAMTAQSAPVLGPQVRCLVLDSPFGSLRRMIANRAAPFGPLGWSVHQVTRVYGWLSLGISEDAVQPEERLEAFAPRPVLVMHTDPDFIIPASEGRALHAAYPGPKEAWFCMIGGHLSARSLAWREWIERTARFLHEHLPGALPPAEVVGQLPADWETFRDVGSGG